MYVGRRLSFQYVDVNINNNSLIFDIPGWNEVGFS